MMKCLIASTRGAGGDRLRIPADHLFRMAAFYQFLYLFRLMQADGDDNILQYPS